MQRAKQIRRTYRARRRDEGRRRAKQRFTLIRSIPISRGRESGNWQGARFWFRARFDLVRLRPVFVRAEQVIHDGHVSCDERHRAKKDNCWSDHKFVPFAANVGACDRIGLPDFGGGLSEFAAQRCSLSTSPHKNQNHLRSSFVSACFHAFLNSLATALASASLRCARKLCSRPNSGQPLAGRSF